MLTRKLIVALMVLALGPVNLQGVPPKNTASDPLHEILRSQPDYVADVVYEANRPVPNAHGWVGRVAKKGAKYRLDVASRRHKGQPGEFTDHTIVIDRSGRIFVLDAATRTAFEGNERFLQRVSFLMSGFSVVAVHEYVNDIGASRLEGVADTDSGPCDIYRARWSWGGELRVYVARNLRNLVVRIDDDLGARGGKVNHFTLTNVVIDPPDLSGELFEVPPDYSRVAASDNDI